MKEIQSKIKMKRKNQKKKESTDHYLSQSYFQEESKIDS